MRVIVVLKKSLYNQLEGEAILAPISRQLKRVHDRHQAMVQETLASLKRQKIRPWIVEGAGVSFDSSNADLVITIGGDGTLLGASHYVGPHVPVLGINSDPLTSVGHFCALTAPPAASFWKHFETELVTRMEVLVQGSRVSKRVLNEALFSHTCPAATSKFTFGARRQDLVTTYQC